MCIFAKRIMRKTFLTYLLLHIWIPLAMGMGMNEGDNTAKHRQRYVVNRSTPERMVIVSRPQFEEQLQPYIAWKREMGYEVDEFYADSNSRDMIKQHLQALYDNATELHAAHRYILIVGDVEHIQSFIGQHKPSDEFVTHITDMYYGEYTGDYIPEAMVGRWSVADSADLEIVMAKSLAYERGQQRDMEYLSHTLLVAGREFGSPAPTTTNGQINYTKRQLMAHDASLDTHCFYNPSSKQQVDSIAGLMGMGMGYVTYTGHCNIGGWLNPNINNTTIATIGDTGRYGVYVNNCCSSNAFGGSCFGERLLRKADGGAVGVVGATNETLWNEDYIWSVGAKLPAVLEPLYDSSRLGALDRLIHINGESRNAQARTLGEMLWAGNYAVTQLGSRYDAYYWEIYCILGDPTLMPYIGMPDTMTVHVPDTMEMGVSHFEVQTNRRGAVVAATSGESLLGVAVTDSTGTGVIHLTHGREEAYITVTTTSQFCLPHKDTIVLSRPANGRLTVVNHNFVQESDSILLHICIKNVGALSAEGHSLTFSWNGIVHSEALPVMDAADTTTVVIPFAYTPTVSVIDVAVALTQDDSAYYSTRLQFEPATVYPHVEWIHVTPMGNGTCEVIATIANTINDSLTAILEGVRHILPPLESSQIVQNIPIEENANHLRVAYELVYAQWHHSDTLWYILDNGDESFESGDFSRFAWDTTSLYSWQIDSVRHQHGRYSARSRVVGHNQRSDLCITVNVTKGDSVSFWSRVSCESNYDRLQFFIDDSLITTLSGEREWERHAYMLETGKHHLQWRYEKDDSQAEGDDGAWIDNIHFPPCIWDAPYGYFDSIPTDVSITPVEDGRKEATLHVYPNPAKEYVVLQAEDITPDSEWRLTIYDATGKVVAQWNADNDIAQGIQYSTNHLRLGVYIIELATATSKTTERLTIVR